MAKEDLKQLQEENAFLKKEVERLKDELVRMVSRNLDLSERLEYDVELKRRTEVAREIMEGNLERQRNADLQDDGQLMAIIEMRLEKDRPHLRPDFDATALAEMLGVSMTRLVQLFRHQTIHRTPDAYIDNLRVLAALRLLREQPNYTIAVVAEEAGFSNVRTLQRRIQEAIGMSPVDYRLMLTRDL
ncbi:MAG: helix-turn-helix domain-containing protein [Prevotella sp.]|nr:helix-turn-helix domain-containing protein [Prevotella sp.]MBO7130278.1 helix-turn-helix domain-containing protein [Prevotella sp.]